MDQDEQRKVSGAELARAALPQPPRVSRRERQLEHALQHDQSDEHDERGDRRSHPEAVHRVPLSSTRRRRQESNDESCILRPVAHSRSQFDARTPCGARERRSLPAKALAARYAKRTGGSADREAQGFKPRQILHEFAPA
jgi:hypothetical protein